MMRGRYSRRTALLEEYCESTGLERKYAIKMMAKEQSVAALNLRFGKSGLLNFNYETHGS